MKRAVNVMPNRHGGEPHTRNPKQEASYVLSQGRWETSIIYLDRSHPPCSCCWDKSQPPLWWCSPHIGIWWKGYWYSVDGYKVEGEVASCLGWFAWMIKMGMLMVLLDPGVNQMVPVQTVYFWWLHFGQRKLEIFLIRRPTNLMCLNSTLLIWLKDSLAGQKGNLTRQCKSLRMIPTNESASHYGDSVWRRPWETPLPHVRLPDNTKLRIYTPQ
jgi:hypothetical protein